MNLRPDLPGGRFQPGGLSASRAFVSGPLRDPKNKEMVNVMTTRSLLLGAVASLVFVSAASAYERNGWYIGLEGGGSWVDDLDGTRSFDVDPPGGGVVVTPEGGPLETGWAALGTVGYGFRNSNFRVELEGGYRDNDLDPSTAGSLTEWSAMINVLYDISLTERLGLSLGAVPAAITSTWSGRRTASTRATGSSPIKVSQA